MARKKKRGLKKRLRNRAVVLAAKVFGGAVPRLSLETVQTLGGTMGAAAELLSGKRKQRLLNHLEIAFPPGQYDEAFRQSIVGPSYRAMGMMFLEAIWAPAWRPGRDNQRVRIEEEENWRRTISLARERGSGLVLFLAHLGTPELLAPWFISQTGIETMAVAARPSIKGLEPLILKKRGESGMKVVFRGDAGLPTRRHLARGGALAMLVDHNLKGHGVEVPFFGKGAHTLLAPARLALQSGAVANTMFALREGKGRFVLRAGEPIIPEPYARDKDERLRQEANLTAEYTRRIEAMIREYPDQYLWMHKRWQKRSDTLPFPSP